jgi:hypothetical protein
LAGFDIGVSVSAETFSGPEAILGQLSLRGGIPFPGNEDRRRAIRGDVHAPEALRVNRFLHHAGLFSSSTSDASGGDFWLALAALRVCGLMVVSSAGIRLTVSCLFRLALQKGGGQSECSGAGYITAD